MAAANVSEDEYLKTIQYPHCSASLTSEIHSQLTFLAVLNIFLAITSFLGNALILVGLRKASSLHPHSKLFLCSLATTDLCVGFISEPLYVIFVLSLVNEHWTVCRYALVACAVAGFTLSGVSLLTVTAISVDRLLALLLGRRYRHVVTLKRAYVIVITFWVVSTFFSTMYLWNSVITRWYNIICVSLCLVASIFSYTKIFLTLRHHQDHVQQQGQTNSLNMARYRKAVSTALWLQMTLVACYLPYGIVTPVMNNNELFSSYVFLAAQYTNALIFLNSSLNPILYCWKIKEVKQAVKETMRQILCCLLS